jgi:hypothetical protein
MAKFQSPLLGYNNNVRHRGRIFHVQTEDSGVAHPHVITHLFMDGGRILKSVKRSYAELVGTDDMSNTVRALMKEQHKAMVVALRDGELDVLVDGKPASGDVASAPKRPVEAKPAPPPEAKSVEPPPPPRPAPRVEEPVPPTISERSNYVPFYAEPPLPPELEALLRDELPPGDAVDAEPPTRRDPPPAAPPELTLDFDALERDAGPSPALYRTDLPPPPVSLFAKERRTGQYRAVEAPGDEVTPPKAARHPTPETAPARAQARPASVPPPPPPSPPRKRSVFGDGSVADMSLDEVILSYLAEDLEPPKK